MRAGQQYRQLFRAWAQTENVSGGVHPHSQSRVFHQTGDVFAGGHFRFRKSQASDAAFGIFAELAQLLERALQTLGVDMKRGRPILLRLRARSWEAGHKQNRNREKADDSVDIPDNICRVQYQHAVLRSKGDQAWGTLAPRELGILRCGQRFDVRRGYTARDANVKSGAPRSG